MDFLGSLQFENEPSAPGPPLSSKNEWIQSLKCRVWGYVDVLDMLSF